MLRPVESPINNPTNDYSKQKVLADLRQNESAPECLRQFLEHERPGTEAILSRNSRLAFLESSKIAPKPRLDLRTLEREIGPILQARPATSQTPADPSGLKIGAAEHLGNIAKNLPFYSSWFDPDKIHPIERQNLPEFFGEKSSKTPRIYQRVRNFLITLYWRNPRSTLHATTARRCVALDAPSVIRVHAFLETWGLINLQTKTKSTGGVEEIGFDFLQPETSQPTPKQHQTIRETPLESSTTEAAFGLLGTPRPKCLQCQQPLQLSWACQKVPQKNTEGAEDTPAPSYQLGLNFCMSCFSQDNYPVFLSAKDFQVVRLRDFVDRAIAEHPGPRPALEFHQALLSDLNSSRLDQVTISDLQAKHPAIPPPLLLATTLHILEARSLEAEAQATGHHLTAIKHRNELTFKMTSMLESLLEKVSSGSPDHSHRSRSREHTLKPLVNFSHEIAAAFALKSEKTLLRLTFLEDFEKIMYQERQNLKGFN